VVWRVQGVYNALPSRSARRASDVRVALSRAWEHARTSPLGAGDIYVLDRGDAVVPQGGLRVGRMKPEEGAR